MTTPITLLPLISQAHSIIPTTPIILLPLVIPTIPVILPPLVILSTPTRTIPITMRFKFHLPLWFERQFHKRLLTAIHHRQDSQRTTFGCSWLGNPHPSYWSRWLVVPMSRVNGGRHFKSLFRCE